MPITLAMTMRSHQDGDTGTAETLPQRTARATLPAGAPWMNPPPPPSTASLLPEESLRWLLGSAGATLLTRRGDALAVQELPTGRFVHVSPGLLDWIGRSASEVLGCTASELFDAPSAAALRMADQSALDQGAALASEHRLAWDGSRLEVSVLRAVSEADAEGRRWLLSVWHDLGEQRGRDARLRSALDQIEQLQRANDLLRQELADQALRDPDSGLHTRAHFEDQLRREVDLSTREHREFAFVFIEFDPVSEHVRALGPAGMRSLHAAMGRLLRGGTRAMDASCRFDERRFAVLLSGVGLATAHSRVESLRRRCAGEIVVHEGRELRFSVAMGVASFPHTAQTQVELLAACEAALAEARRRGGNVVTLAAIRFESD
jgi:diguanylate cyclase (GGDEF)-like protein